MSSTVPMPLTTQYVATPRPGSKRVLHGILVLGLAVVVLVAPAIGRPADVPSTEVVGAWRVLAIADVEAIRQGLLTLHPAMRDADAGVFETRLETAYRAARRRADTAAGFLDWRDAVNGFVLAFRDGHTFVRFNALPARALWPGFLIDSRGVDRVATAAEADSDVANGDVLLACDGKPIETLLEENLDGREADWSKAPERIRQAWRLLIDYRTGQPATIASCTFDRRGAPRAVRLKWRTASSAELAAKTLPLLRTPAIDRPDRLDLPPRGGALIRLGSFGDEGALEAVERAMRARLERLRAAPFIVFDLRGNRGGNSTWGERFGGVLWGEAAMQARARPSLGKEFRASPEAIAQYRAMAARFDAAGPDMAGPAGYWHEIAARVAASTDGDARLFVDYGPEEPRPVTPLPVPARTGPVFVLTDAGCFSSCVLVADALHRMGAVQIGEPTGQNEPYGEVAGPLDLPSGLGRWWVPLSIIRQTRDSLGGLPVDIAWTGAIDDDAAIFRWIAQLAKHTAPRRVEGPR